MGRRCTRAATRQLRFSALGSGAGIGDAGRRQCVRCGATGRKRLGMDLVRICSLCRIPDVLVLSEVLERLLRWRAFRAEGGLSADRSASAAALVPQLVSPAVSVRLRHVPDGPKLMLAAVAVEEFAADVRRGLGGDGQKQLPPKYFYDDLGSALFDAITLVPEYGLTRADERILQSCARELVNSFAGDAAVVELGSGSGRKTRLVLEAMRRRQPETHYYAID